MSDLRPPRLPLLTFILSDWTNRALATDIAKALEVYDPEAVRWDFEEPAHDALSSLLDSEFGQDFGDPRTCPDADKLTAMIHFINAAFGDDYFGARAFMEAREQIDFRSDPIIFRDASWLYIKPFLQEFKPHELLIADLFSYGYTKNMPISEETYKSIGSRILLFAKPTVENVVEAIKEASK